MKVYRQSLQLTLWLSWRDLSGFRTSQFGSFQAVEFKVVSPRIFGLNGALHKQHAADALR